MLPKLERTVKNHAYTTIDHVTLIALH